MTTAERVDAIFWDCLYKDNEIVDGVVPSGTIVVEGIMHKFGFHPTRVGSHKEEVREILDTMPPAFHKEHGGGMSFLNLCDDKDGNQWTGQHSTMEQLLVLAIATGMGAYCIQREMWSMFPGNMPYVVFDTRA